MFPCWLTFHFQVLWASETKDKNHLEPQDMSSASDVQDFVLDFRRCGALNVLRQHLRLNTWAKERQRLLAAVNFEAEGGYLCNVNVLRLAVKALVHWLEDLDSSFLEEEGRHPQRRHLFREEWDALVLYSQLSDAQLCGDEEPVSRRPRRGYSASGVLLEPSETEQRERPLAVQQWVEFQDHFWGEAPQDLQNSAETVLAILKERWPQLSAQGPRNVWVLKPGSSSKGSGVLCMDSLPEVLQHCKKASNRIVQKYIERPLLLFSGRKFDLRQWVLVRSFQPLKVYMFSSCYLRLCNEPYDLGDLANRQRHISNWSVNKNGRHVADGAVASLEEFRDVLESITNSRTYWEEALVPQLQSCILQSLRAVQERVVQRPECFEVYGFDFMIAEDLKPWLLEVNLSPACESRTPWMSEMLERMASRLVELVLQGALEPDGEEPDWVCIADEASVKTAEILSDWERSKDMPPKLAVLGQPLNRRLERHLEDLWRRQQAQLTLGRCLRGFLVRRQKRRQRALGAVRLLQRGARRWLARHRARREELREARNLLRGAARRFLGMLQLRQCLRRHSAVCVQRLWRGHLGQGRAKARRRLVAVLRLQRSWRSWRHRRRRLAQQRVARCWRDLLARRRADAAKRQAAQGAAATKLQAFLRGTRARRRAAWLQRLVAPSRHLALVLSLARWRRQLALQRRHLAVQRLQSAWRACLGRRLGALRLLRRQWLPRLLRAWWRQHRAAQRAAARAQRVWRGAVARRRARRRRGALRRLQRAWRGVLARRHSRRVHAATEVQKCVRGLQCRKQHKRDMDKVHRIQKAWRRWIARRRLAMLRRFAERRRRWLAVEEWSSCVKQTKEEPEEDAATGSPPGSPRQSPSGVESESSSAKTADENEISIGLENEHGSRSCGFTVGLFQERPDSRETEVKTFAAGEASPVKLTGVDRGAEAALAVLRELRDSQTRRRGEQARLGTGSALRAARQLRWRPEPEPPFERERGYARSTLSSTLRSASVGERTAKDTVRTLNGLFHATYTSACQRRPRPSSGRRRPCVRG
ncbi:unnamed protein product [Effrenium voratum]|nr:unnamed protein product [Effrenium voratum]